LKQTELEEEQAIMAAKARDGAGKATGPRSDAYTGMLLISLLAQIAGVVFLFLDWSQYPAEQPKEPPALPALVAGGGAPAGPGPGAAGPGAGGVPKGPGAK
jgi:hypothetical protein